jgi:hypothetical protein
VAYRPLPMTVVHRSRRNDDVLIGFGALVAGGMTVTSAARGSTLGVAIGDGLCQTTRRTAERSSRLVVVIM